VCRRIGEAVGDERWALLKQRKLDGKLFVADAAADDDDDEEEEEENDKGEELVVNVRLCKNGALAPNCFVSAQVGTFWRQMAWKGSGKQARVRSSNGFAALGLGLPTMVWCVCCLTN